MWVADELLPNGFDICCFFFLALIIFQPVFEHFSHTPSNTAPIPVIYGERRIGGTPIYYQVTGDNNEYLHIVLLLCEGEIESVEQVYLNDEPIFETETRGEIDSGKKGSLAMYFVNRIKPEFSADPEGLKPNDMFEQRFGKLMRVYES